MDLNDYNRRRRRIDWMLSAHAKLRDRYVRRSRALTLGVIGLSTAGLTLALANGDQRVTLLGVDGNLQVFLAALAALTFVVGLVDLVVDWRRRAWAHEEAARKLAELKALFVRHRPEDGHVADGDRLVAEYDRTTAAISPIPESQAARQKARHLRKVELFKRLDKQPTAPVSWLRLVLWWEGVRNKDRS